MANLIVPNKYKHKYVVGIDFGHGETSAAVCPIEWDKSAGQRVANYEDIYLDPAQNRVITSAICRVSGSLLIGDDAFEHMTDNEGLRICFKQKPESLDGEAEKLMIDYMEAIYARIREYRTELTDSNHIVYIARPSGWIEENTKELYRQMAIKAGIPLGGLTSESRAAIFYAKSPSVQFQKEISQGAIVFDLGSSTLDFTYISDTAKPIDFGYDLGASIIDNIIFENMILKDEKVFEFLNKYPVYTDALKFQARKFKETAYGRNENLKTIGDFPLTKIINEDEESFDEYARTYVPLKIANLSELNTLIEKNGHYIEHLKDALNHFRTNKIPGKKVSGVFLTGGASRMNFIRPLIAEEFNLPLEKIKIDGNDTSLTVSRGIALLGTTDAITSVLVSELKSQLPSLINNDVMLSNLTLELASNITNESWRYVDSACSYWIKYGKTTDEDELKRMIENNLRDFQRNRVSTVVNETLHTYIKNSTEEIRKQMNNIISRYAPGREIASTGRVEVGDIQAINSSLSNMSSEIAKICDSISNVLADILWVALGVFLWGIFCAPYYIYKYFRSDESKRKDKAEKILDKKSKITFDIQSKIISELNRNSDFRNTISKSFSDYFTKLIETNIQQVKIPIE
ncbi:hypothetical protein H6A61_14320 [Bacteroides caecigallinarum]|uniref:Hsp70 family protein n=1 Tax=Bacteroides caecigallinarum TaxID=1411144 RepID=UPI00195C9CD3|nr:hypothetical protein [Bacteroides caecigallinarum]MBM6962009.1 hypothetical protein [Bacteroides caecigallinarum]